MQRVDSDDLVRHCPPFLLTASEPMTLPTLFVPHSVHSIDAGFALWCNKKGGHRDMPMQAMCSYYLFGAIQRVGWLNLMR